MVNKNKTYRNKSRKKTYNKYCEECGEKKASQSYNSDYLCITCYNSRVESFGRPIKGLW